MIKFIPTITNNFNKINLEDYDEILLTPSLKTETLIPLNYKGDIIIDNGGFCTNVFNAPLERLDRHLEICVDLKDEHNCIFVLPDIRRSHDKTLEYIEKFLKNVNPKRYILVDMFKGFKDIIKKEFNIKPEFYATNSNRKDEIENSGTYHVLGKIKSEDFSNFRSYDTSIF